MSFFDKLNQTIARNRSLLVVGLDPNPEFIYDLDNKDKIIALSAEHLKKIISATQDKVCAYKPTLGFYQALGVEGIRLLEDILEAIPEDIPVILDAKHSDLNSSTLLARSIFEIWNVDAVTLTAYAGQDLAAPFLVYPEKGVFILAKTSNQGAIALQEYPRGDNPYYLHLVAEVKTWAPPEQLYLEVGTTKPEILEKIRAIAPERFILMRSIWAEAGNLKDILTAGLNKNGEGLLIPVPSDWLVKDDFVSQVEALRGEINEIRSQVNQEDSRCELWISDVCLLNTNPLQDLILQLYDLGCILFGEYVQASGATFSYYIDLRTIISNPQVFSQVLKAYGEILKKLNFERIAGLPYGALPTATGLALNLNYPMIFPRKEVKAHGTRRLIEGHYECGETVVVIDDILISGNSAIEGAKKLESAGLKVNDIVVFIDHEKGVKDKLKEAGYNAYSVLTISQITQTLYEASRITEEQYESFITGHQ